MSYIHKLGSLICVALVVASIGAISLNAQTPVENSSTSAVASTSSTVAPKGVDNKKPSTTPVENLPLDEKSEVSSSEDTATTSAATPSATTTNAPTTPRPQAVDQDKWQFQVTPYFWLASAHGTVGLVNRTATVDESFGDIFNTLNFFIMGTFEARKGKFISLTDLEYINISDEKATPGPFFSAVDAGFKTFIFDPEVGYRLLENSAKGASLDVMGGARVWSVKTDLEFGAGILPAARIEASRSWVDAVGGLRGKMALSEKLFLTGKFDLGGGGSKFTWQVFGGGGYNINPKIALTFGYRALDVNYDKNNFVYDMNQRGPIVGLGFRF